MIPLRDQEHLQTFFSRHLTGPVKIEHVTQRPLAIVVPGREECRYCNETRRVLEELNALSPRISLRVQELSQAKELATRYGVDRVPATILRGQLNRPLLFFGFFSATLFPAMIEAIVAVSRGETGATARIKRRLKRIDEEIQVRLFVSPSCPYSPAMMQMLFRFSLENPRIKATAIEVEEFPRLAEVHRIRAVPFTTVGDRVSFSGAVDEEGLLDQITKVVERQTLSAGEGLLPSGRPSTPLQAPAEAAPSRSGLIVPGR